MSSKSVVLWAGLLLLMAGCSAFQPDKQKLYVSALTPGTVIELNGAAAGIDRITHDVARDRSVTVIGLREGRICFVRSVQSVPSITGKLDAAGAYFLLPSIGLFFPGSRELETDEVVIP